MEVRGAGRRRGRPLHTWGWEDGRGRGRLLFAGSSAPTRTDPLGRPHGRFQERISDLATHGLCMLVCVCAQPLDRVPLYDAMDYSPPGSYGHG